VDLSVLAWILSISAMLWATITDYKFYRSARLALVLAFIGCLLIAFSPLDSEGKALMSNYIPVLTNFPFFLGVATFSAAILLQIFITLLSFPLKKEKREISTITSIVAIYTLALIGLWTFLCFAMSHFALKTIIKEIALDQEYFYETLFWSGGHILQFLYTQLGQLAWLYLLSYIMPLPKKPYTWLFVLNLLFVLPIPLVYLIFPVNSGEFIQFFTDHMRYLGGVTPTICGAYVCYKLWQSKSTISYGDPVVGSLISSLIVFFAGGVIALMIKGANVTIPAHYHGSIVGITIAAMGIVYLSFAEQNKASSILAKMQPYLLGLGQILHISGLAWSGGYGVLRKSTDTIISAKARISMGLMGGGGLLAVIGGLLFVYIASTLILKRKD
jgi:hypothetical protein